MAIEISDLKKKLERIAEGFRCIHCSHHRLCLHHHARTAPVRSVVNIAMLIFITKQLSLITFDSVYIFFILHGLEWSGQCVVLLSQHEMLF